MSDERLMIEVVGAEKAPAELPRAGVLVVGSDPARAGVLVQGPEVEGAHCAIGRAKGGGWAVRDLSSGGGTYLNGKRVASARLAAGDVLRVGGRDLAIFDPSARGATTSTAAPIVKPAAEPARVPADDETRGVELETPLGADLASTAEKRDQERASDRAKPSITGYRVDRPLGRGGMGQVFLALQESLQRPVALKVLARRLSQDAEFVRRFQAEARAAAALNHPNVVTVYDVGVENGTHYLSMEYMDKGNLEERVAKGGRLPWREVLDVLRDAGQGLAFAESRGIVHRDLKPANLMQNSAGQTKIADLGLATHVEAEESSAADKKVFGTPHFMSPEQARGEKVDSRSDLYSLGATAYRLLTAHTPFEGSSAKELVRAHVKEEPRPLKELAPDVPDGVRDIVVRSMQKDPAARFQSANELLREIERVRATAERGTLGASASGATPRRARKSSGSRALAWLVILAALGGGGYWYATTPQGAELVRKGRAWVTEQTAKHDDGAQAPRGPGDGRDGRVADATPSSNAKDAASKPGDATTNDAAPKPAPRNGAPRDDDAALQLAEANAKLALMELEQREMSKRDRRDELRILSANHRGTTAATEAWQKAEALAAELAQEETQKAQASTQLSDIVAKLRESAALDRDPPEPGKALLAISKIDGQAAYAQDPQFLEAKKQVEREIMQNAVRYAERVLAQCQGLAQKGEFDKIEQKLNALMPLFDLPEYPLGEGPAGVQDLYTVGRSAREQLKTLELTRMHFEVEQKKDEAKAIAVTFGGPDGLEKELRALDLHAARTRVAGAATSVTTPEARQFLTELDADLARGQSALELVAREYASWKRKSITDPRDRKGTTRNAVGADAGGLLVEGEGGKVDHVDWSAFGGNARDLARLFTERLAREYTTDEMRGIAALLRVCAVIEAIDLSSKMLDPTKKANFSETNAREIVEAYSPAVQWAQRSGDTAATTRELAAATELANVMQRVTEGAWSIAVDGTERLLASAQDSLLVRLLSDGSLQLEPPVANPPDANAAKPAGDGAQPAAPTEPPKKPKEGR